MLVYEFLEMFTESNAQRFELWSNEEEKVIFTGFLDELPQDLQFAEVTSVDNITTANTITLNINL